MLQPPRMLGAALSKTKIRAFRHQAYGLLIIADVPIPELPALRVLSVRSAVRATLAGRFQRLRLDARWYLRSRLAGGATWLRSGKTECGYVLSFPDIADFLVDRSGSQVTCCNASGGVSLETIRHLLLDQVLPLMINLRGCEALHATAIATHRGVCAFTGPAGSGKSTLAASFVLSGYRLVCDDCLALSQGSRVMTLPGYPGLRLWNDSIRALGASSRNLKADARFTAKSRWQNSRPVDFCSTTRRLARVYLIERARSSKHSAPVLIQELAPGDALIALVRAAYRLDITDRAMLRRQFQFLSRVAECVLIKRLIMPNTFSALSDVREVVLDDLSSRYRPAERYTGR